MADTKAEKWQEIGERILNASRSEIYMNMRFLNLALSGLTYEVNAAVPLAATNGFALYYAPERLADLYCQSRNAVNRMYLHILFHCILRHLVKYENREPPLWDIACDVAVESIIDSLQLRIVYRQPSGLRQSFYRECRQKLNMKTLTAQGIYRVLLSKTEEERLLLAAEFFCDSHELWYPMRQSQRQINLFERKWGEIGEKTETNIEMFAPMGGSGSGDVIGQLHSANRPRYSYQDFLRKFAVLREETTLDLDNYDLTFYTYGLEFYGNMPLIEPLEFKEVKKIEEFAIVLDTSRSCSGELLRQFLEQTYTILKLNDGFFHDVNIHVIQCDEKIQSDITLHHLSDIEQYAADFSVHGGGGTDFRPAFAYVNTLIENGSFQNLKGLLYFTDGLGTYPTKRPPYDTAFIFVRTDETEDVTVPPWAMKIILEPEDLSKENNRPT